MQEKQDFNFAHRDASVSERPSRTAGLNKFNFSPLIQKIRAGAFARGIPVSSDETLAYLCICTAMAKPHSILEIGTAVGVSGICMLNQCPSAHLTTIEIDKNFAEEAAGNFVEAGVDGRVNLLVGDAGQIIDNLDGPFDFIFLDGPKVQYIKYLPRLKRLLCSGGVLFADDVLLFGWVNGEAEVPKKRKMLVEHIREYIAAATADPDLITTIVDVGDGVALSIKK